MRDQLEPFLTGHLADTVRNNFSTLNDHFFVSFVFFSLAAGSDYFFHNPILPTYHNGWLKLLIGGGFFAGIVTLMTPMFCLRSVIRGRKSWANINPPTWGWVILISSITGLLTYLSFFASSTTSPSHGYLALSWVFIGMLTMLGGYEFLVHERNAEKIWILLWWLPIFAIIELWVLPYFLHPQ